MLTREQILNPSKTYRGEMDVELERQLPPYRLDLCVRLPDSYGKHVTGYGVIVDHPDGWEHAAMEIIHPEKMTPIYPEMCALKDTCFAPDELTIQVHPRASEYVNRMPHMLHLWRHKPMTDAERLTERNLIAQLHLLKELLHNFRVRHTLDGRTEYAQGELKTFRLVREDCSPVVIFGDGDWPTWDEICKVKRRYFCPEEAALQFNLGTWFDLNPYHLVLLFPEGVYPLPPMWLV